MSTDNCPITKEARKELLKHVVRPDWEQAAQIYHKNSKKQIYPRYLERFLRCYSNPTGRHPGSHQPLTMYEAITTAVAQRQQTERDQNSAATKLLNQILRDTKPAQPIAL